MAEKKTAANRREASERAATLTDDERATIRKSAMAAVEEEVKKAAMAAALDIETRALRIEAGLEKADPSWETVTIAIDLAKGQQPCITLDQSKTFYHGTEVTVTKDVAQTLVAIMSDGWANERREKGDWIAPAHLMMRPTASVPGKSAVAERFR